jgi:hypothetical protein
MRISLTLTAALLAIAASAHSASAQRTSGGGTIGCDPGLPTFAVQATSCRIFFKEALYGPGANPYASAWGGSSARTVAHGDSRTSRKSRQKKRAPAGTSAN